MSIRDWEKAIAYNQIQSLSYGKVLTIIFGSAMSFEVYQHSNNLDYLLILLS